METVNNLDSIKAQIIKIFEDRFNINTRKLNENFFDEELLGPNIRLKARDLIYLFFEVENNFKISIPEENIVNGDFNTLNKIYNVVVECLYK